MEWKYKEFFEEEIRKIKKDIEKLLEGHVTALYPDNAFQIDNTSLFLRYNDKIPFLMSEKTWDEVNKNE
jgi:hypothetical protein